MTQRLRVRANKRRQHRSMGVRRQDGIPQRNDADIPSSAELADVARNGDVIFFYFKTGINQQHTTTRGGRRQGVGHAEPVGVIAFHRIR